ncbi:MAG TPA: PEP-CTERM sorting domain-containing protein [Armatimonadota bacterium]|nr:PEP-CTERM sorting domain-containing protein [Armatimonadota bacterium]
MRIVLSLLCVALFTLQLTVCAAKDAGTGGASFDAGVRMQFRAQAGSLDGFDATDHIAVPYEGWNGGVYHVQGQDGWLGETGFYSIDYRSPLMPGETKSWTFYIWALPGTAASDMRLVGGFSNHDVPNLHIVLEYIQKPAGVTGGPAVGTTWTYPEIVNVLLPFYSTSDGLTGHGFRLTLTAVPEPSSILALAGGIAGLGGLVLRRRKV